MFAGSNLWRSIALAGGVALHAINVYVVTTILPSIVSDIGGLDYYAWNTTLFVVASILGSAASTKVLQTAGPRGAYCLAAAIFASGSVLCAIAPTMTAMLVGRVVQGLGGGVLFALPYALIRIIFERAVWPRAMALLSAMWGIATLVGPAVGGIFAELNMWRMAFWSLLPVTMAFIAIAWTILPGRGAEAAPPDRLPVVQIAILALVALGFSASSVLPTLATKSIVIFASAVLAAVFCYVEKTRDRKLLPRQTLSGASRLGATYLVLGLLSFAMTGEIFVPYFLQVIHNQSPLMAGYLTALMAGGWTLGSMLSSGWSERRAELSIIVGPCLLAGALVILSVLVPDSSNDFLARSICYFGLFLVGFGIGLGWPHLLTHVLVLADADEQDKAAASITTIQLSATAFGSAVAGLVANAAGMIVPGGLNGAQSAAIWLFGLLALCPLAALWISAGMLRRADRERTGLALQSPRQEIL